MKWVLSQGSNKANENLRAGVIDIGSTAGIPALLARADGSPIKAIDVISRPERSAIVVPAGSPLTSVRQLRGGRVAATEGTDPYFFLLQALGAAGLTADDIEIVNLQHADGRVALESGTVAAWAGLDPVPGVPQREILNRLLPLLVTDGLVRSEAEAVAALDTLFEPRFAEQARGTTSAGT